MGYFRADRLEEQILNEVQNIFSNETLLAEIWQEAQKKLTEEAPNIDEELRHHETNQSKVQAKLDRYFTAFESGTMDTSTCNQRIQDLQTQLDQLKEEHVAKSDSRQSLDCTLPAE